MKSKVFGFIFSIGFLISLSCYGEALNPKMPSSCQKICESGILDRESCSCEMNSNPKPARRIWPALEEDSDEGAWDEEDDE